MALITDLPAASGLSNTDLLVIETGSQTKKITVADAAASMGLRYLRQWQNSAGGPLSCTIARANIYPTYTRPTGFIVYGYEGITYFNVTGANTSLTVTKVGSLGNDCVTYNASTKTLTSVSSNRTLTIIADDSFTFTWQ